MTTLFGVIFAWSSLAFGQAAQESAAIPAVSEPSPPSPSESLIVEIEGEVSVRGPAQSSGRNIASVPARLGAEDEVSTGRGGRAVVTLKDLSELRLGPKSRFRLDEESPSLASVSLLIGRLWAKVSVNAGRRFRVVTPAAVAAVRGTEFSVEAPNAKRTIVEVYSGAVFVVAAKDGAPFGEEALVGASRRVEVRGGRLGPIETLKGALPAAPGKTAGAAAGAELREELLRESRLQLGQDAAQSAAAASSANPLSKETDALGGAAGSASSASGSAGQTAGQTVNQAAGAAGAAAPPLIVPDPGSLKLPDLPH